MSKWIERAGAGTFFVAWVAAIAGIGTLVNGTPFAESVQSVGMIFAAGALIVFALRPTQG